MTQAPLWFTPSVGPFSWLPPYTVIWTKNICLHHSIKLVATDFQIQFFDRLLLKKSQKIQFNFFAKLSVSCYIGLYLKEINIPQKTVRFRTEEYQCSAETKTLDCVRKPFKEKFDPLEAKYSKKTWWLAQDFCTALSVVEVYCLFSVHFHSRLRKINLGLIAAESTESALVFYSC